MSGTTWTESDYEALDTYLQDEKPINYIARKLKRSPRAIRYRLARIARTESTASPASPAGTYATHVGAPIREQDERAPSCTLGLLGVGFTLGVIFCGGMTIYVNMLVSNFRQM